MSDIISGIYEAYEGSDELEEYMRRHGIDSAGILTLYEDEKAADVADYLAPRIDGKTVVEIGGGIGLLSLHMSSIAKRVYCIEASPLWTSCFVALLVKVKPKNVSFLFGAAEEFAGTLKADVALFCTHSGVKSMTAAASLFAPEVVDVYGELMQANPARFDHLASRLRAIS